MSKKLSKIDFMLADTIKSFTVIMGLMDSAVTAYGAVQVGYSQKYKDLGFFPDLYEDTIYGILLFSWDAMYQAFSKEEIMQFAEDNLDEERFYIFKKVNEKLLNLSKEWESRNE